MSSKTTHKPLTTNKTLPHTKNTKMCARPNVPFGTGGQKVTQSLHPKNLVLRGYLHIKALADEAVFEPFLYFIFAMYKE